MANILQKNIIKDLGIDKFPQEQQEKMLLSIGRIIYQSVLLRVMGELNDKEKEEFEKLLTGQVEEEKVLNFLAEKIPNLNEVVEEEVAKFKKESSDFSEKVLNE